MTSSRMLTNNPSTLSTHHYRSKALSYKNITKRSTDTLAHGLITFIQTTAFRGCAYLAVCTLISALESLLFLFLILGWLLLEFMVSGVFLSLPHFGGESESRGNGELS